MHLYFGNVILAPQINTTDKGKQATLVLCKSQLQFHLTNYYQLLYITSTIYFQSVATMGIRNAIRLPAASPESQHPLHDKYYENHTVNNHVGAYGMCNRFFFGKGSDRR